MLIVGAAGEEVLLGLHFSMGTVRADTALFGQPVLAISARLYSEYGCSEPLNYWTIELLFYYELFQFNLN